MILIENIEYYQNIGGELVFKGKAKIQQELMRPWVQFKNTKGEIIKFLVMNMNFIKPSN